MKDLAISQMMQMQGELHVLSKDVWSPIEPQKEYAGAFQAVPASERREKE